MWLDQNSDWTESHWIKNHIDRGQRSHFFVLALRRHIPLYVHNSSILAEDWWLWWAWNLLLWVSYLKGLCKLHVEFLYIHVHVYHFLLVPVYGRKSGWTIIHTYGLWKYHSCQFNVLHSKQFLGYTLPEYYQCAKNIQLWKATPKNGLYFISNMIDRCTRLTTIMPLFHVSWCFCCIPQAEPYTDRSGVYMRSSCSVEAVYDCT